MTVMMVSPYTYYANFSLTLCAIVRGDTRKQDEEPDIYVCYSMINVNKSYS